MSDNASLLALLRQPGNPLMTLEAARLYGVTESEGARDNPVILGWARELGLAAYSHDSIPWCGLAAAIVARRAGKPIPAEPLWALNWRGFGVAVDRPALGDIMVKTRKGGGHVTNYAGETRTHYICLGGNQDDRFAFSAIPKSGDFNWYFRRPRYRVQPATVRPLLLSAAGVPQTREA